MSLGVKKGETVTVSAEGEDEEKQLPTWRHSLRKICNGRDSEDRESGLKYARKCDSHSHHGRVR